MVAIPAEDVLALLVEESHQQRVLIVETTPEGELWLQDDAQFVGRGESGFGWTPRVKPHVVQTVGGTFA